MRESVVAPGKSIARLARWPKQDVAAVLRKFGSRLWVQAAVFLSLLLLRCTARLVQPQVWDEDGTNILDFVHHGLRSLFIPVNGYLLLLPKCITVLSLSVSFSYYPLISTVLAWAVMVGALIIVASPRTQLRGGLLLGALALLVPSDIEVFGLPLYTFWWVSLALFAVILWEENSTDLKWRLPIVALSGLSSPVIIGVAPFFLLRCAFYRKLWREWVVSSAAVLCAVVQFVIWKSWTAKFAPPVSLTAAKAARIAPEFFGRYLVGNLLGGNGALWVAAILVVAFLTVAAWRCRHSPAYLCVTGLLIASIAMVAGRVDIAIIHPVFAGPRYFFFTFVLISWCLLQVAVMDKSWSLKAISGLLIAVSVANAVPVRTRRRPDDLHWREHVASCPFFPHDWIPVESNGFAGMAWWLDLTGTECQTLLRHDLLQNVGRRPLTFPYVVLPYVPVHSSSLVTSQSVVRNEWPGAVPQLDRLAGFDTVISVGAPHPGAEIALRLKRGEAVLYRSGTVTAHLRVLINGGKSSFLQALPTLSTWSVLSFSSSLLPEQFTVTFVGGNTPVEPVALGLAKRVAP